MGHALDREPGLVCRTTGRERGREGGREGGREVVVGNSGSRSNHRMCAPSIADRSPSYPPSLPPSLPPSFPPSLLLFPGGIRGRGGNLFLRLLLRHFLAEEARAHAGKYLVLEREGGSEGGREGGKESSIHSYYPTMPHPTVRP